MKHVTSLSYTLLFLTLLFPRVRPEPDDKKCFCIPLDLEISSGPETPENQTQQESSGTGWNVLKYTAGITAVAAVGAVAFSGPLLTMAGFTTKGVSANSVASRMMALYGGSIAKGSLVSTLQSVGAQGGVLGPAASDGAQQAFKFVVGKLASSASQDIAKNSGKESLDGNDESPEKPSVKPTESEKRMERESSTSPTIVCFFDEDYSGSANGDMTAHELYPDGKRLTLRELLTTPLHEECEIHIP